MRVQREIKVGERTVTVKELTVGEIRAWLAEAESKANAKIDVIDEVLLDGLTLPELGLMTDLLKSDMDEMAPSQLAELLAVARELNPAFFGLRERLLQAVQLT